MSSLRSYYGQIRQTYLASISKSGNGTNAVKKPAWPYYEMLSFLNDSLTAKSSLSNLKRKEINTEIGESNAHSSKKSLKKGNSNEEQWFANQNEFMTKALKSFETPSETSEDELFGKLVAKGLAKIFDEDIKDELKISIQQLINQAKKRSYND